jgi:hypothetical protein
MDRNHLTAVLEIFHATSKISHTITAQALENLKMPQRTTDFGQLARLKSETLTCRF